MVSTRAQPDSTAGQGYSAIELGRSVRVSLTLVPEGRGRLEDQAREIFEAQRQVLQNQRYPMVVTSQTVFLRNPSELQRCRSLLSTIYGAQLPATNIVFQPPCCGAALALEAWAIGGEDVLVEQCGPSTTAVTYQGTRWIYCSGISSKDPNSSVYEQASEVLAGVEAGLKQARTGFDRVVRTWFYLGAITEPDKGVERYKELNRARTDFYRNIHFHCSTSEPNIPQGIYPASTGIGTAGTGLVAGCVALETDRTDALLLPLENPQQTPAYAYHPKFSPQSPKFSRGVALVLGDYTTTWLSGTASVVYSGSRYPDDIKRQTEQTIENIERLISEENFAFHGIKHVGARLHDLAKIRVYIKRAEDFARCKVICQKRFGPVPAIYALADVCRPELLVEIEGVAFSRRINGSPVSGCG
ncbi:MAG TPA: RidA family protein [Verrucomicrobiae bacterium]|nr:RidA family protein [Verrucomicrobiae bacterium]